MPSFGVRTAALGLLILLAAVALLSIRSKRDVRPAGQIVRIGCTDCPPFDDQAGANPMSGFAVAVAAEAASRLKLPVHFQPVTQSGKKALLKGEVDIWPRLAPDSSTGSLFIGEPWINMNYSLLVRRGAPPLSAGSQLKIAHVEDAFLRNLVNQAAPGATSVPSRPAEILARVCLGEADAAFLESRVAYALLLSDHGGTCNGVGFETRPVKGLTRAASLGARKEFAWAARQLREEIGRMAADGSLSELHAKWFYSPASETGMLELIQTAEQDLFTLRAVAGLLAFLLLLLAYQSRRLGRAREAAERANDLKTRFVASVSHELRTPLSGIIGVTEMLGDTPLTAHQSELVRLARSTSQTLVQVLTDLLDVASVEAGNLAVAHSVFELRAAVDEVVVMVAGRAAEKGIQLDTLFEPGLPRRVQGDPARLRQVLMNLLANSVKFTDQGGVKLQVSLEQASPFNWTVAFAVADTGTPIPKADLARILDDFSSVPPGQELPRRAGGVGLAISRRLIKLMGGVMTVASDPAMGTCFRFTLPFEVAGSEYSPGEQPATTTPTTQQRGRRLRVLVCEDDPVSRKVAVHMLGKLAHHVEAVTRGADAVELAARQQFDLVLMDCQLPDIDGFEAARQIRSGGGASAGAPVVALTAAALSEDRQRCKDHGMDGFLAKPLSLAALADALGQFGPEASPRPAAQLPPPPPPQAPKPGDGRDAILRA